MNFKVSALHRAVQGALLTIALSSATSALAEPAKTLITPPSKSYSCERIEYSYTSVSVGKTIVLKPGRVIDRIVLGNPDGSRAAQPVEGAKGEKDEDSKADKLRPGVAGVDVLLISRSELFLVGKTVGTSNLVLRHEDGGCTAYDVVVTMDTSAIQAVINHLLPEEKNVKVQPAFDSVVVSGTVTDGPAAARVLELVNAYVRGAGAGVASSVAGANPRIVNMLSTAAPQQVMLEVKVAEISKALINKLGAQFAGVKIDGSWTFSLLSSFLSGGAGVIEGIKTNPNSAYGLLIDAQKDDGLVKVLAEPTIMAISGQKGSFNAGGKIFIPVSQDSGNGGRTITLEEKPFGVSVNFLPTVLSSGQINLEVATEVSELNRNGIGIQAPGVSGTAILPSFTSRSAKTTVQLKDGQSFAIGGLIKNNSSANIKAFPILGEVPILGALFRSTDFQTDKSELVFVITPRLVKPLNVDYKLPASDYVPPTRSEMHFGGKLEGSPSLEQKTDSTNLSPKE